MITYAARDERTNLRRPPAVPLGELLDLVDRTARFPDGATDARARRRRASAAAVRPAQLRRGRARARADVELRSRRAGRCAGPGGRPGRRAAVPRRPLPHEPEPVIELDQLVRFVQHPAAGVPASAARRRRQRARRRRGRRIVGRARRARALERRRAAARGAARGRRREGRDRGRDRPRRAAARTCSPSPCSRMSIRSSSSSSQRRRTTFRAAERERLGRRAGGAARRSRADRHGARRPRRPRRRLDVLASRAEAPADRMGLPARARSSPPGRRPTRRSRSAGSAPTGRKGKRGDGRPHPPAERSGRAAGGGAARLAVLVDLFERGMREPLPLYCKHLGRLRRGGRGRQGRTGCSRQANGLRLELHEGGTRTPSTVLVLGGTRTVDELFAEPPRDDEQGDGWAVDEPSRAGRYARRLWDGLLAARGADRPVSRAERDRASSTSAARFPAA